MTTQGASLQVRVPPSSACSVCPTHARAVVRHVAELSTSLLYCGMLSTSPTPCVLFFVCLQVDHTAPSEHAETSPATITGHGSTPVMSPSLVQDSTLVAMQPSTDSSSGQTTGNSSSSWEGVLASTCLAAADSNISIAPERISSSSSGPDVAAGGESGCKSPPQRCSPSKHVLEGDDEGGDDVSCSGEKSQRSARSSPSKQGQS